MKPQLRIEILIGGSARLLFSLSYRPIERGQKSNQYIRHNASVQGFVSNR